MIAQLAAALPRWREIPEGFYQLICKAFYGGADPLVKGAGHKYIRRVPTGKTTKTGRPVYRYHYRVTGGHGLAHHNEIVEGAAFQIVHNGQKGHFHVEKVDGDKVTVRHDESGHTQEMTKQELRAALHAHHDDEIKQVKARAHAAFREARAVDVEEGRAQSGHTQRAQRRVSKVEGMFPSKPSEASTDEARSRRRADETRRPQEAADERAADKEVGAEVWRGILNARDALIRVQKEARSHGLRFASIDTVSRIEGSNLIGERRAREVLGQIRSAIVDVQGALDRAKSSKVRRDAKMIGALGAPLSMAIRHGQEANRALKKKRGGQPSGSKRAVGVPSEFPHPQLQEIASEAEEIRIEAQNAYKSRRAKNASRLEFAGVHLAEAMDVLSDERKVNVPGALLDAYRRAESAVSDLTSHPSTRDRAKAVLRRVADIFDIDAARNTAAEKKATEARAVAARRAMTLREHPHLAQNPNRDILLDPPRGDGAPRVIKVALEGGAVSAVPAHVHGRFAVHSDSTHKRVNVTDLVSGRRVAFGSEDEGEEMIRLAHKLSGAVPQPSDMTARDGKGAEDRRQVASILKEAGKLT